MQGRCLTLHINCSMNACHSFAWLCCVAVEETIFLSPHGIDDGPDVGLSRSHPNEVLQMTVLPLR